MMKFLRRVLCLVFLLTCLLHVIQYRIAFWGSNLIPIHALLNVSDRVNEHNFQLLINPQVSKCSQNDLLLTAVVSIAPDYFDRRRLIRETWASVNDSNFLVLFALGLSRDSSVNNLIYQESILFNDIIQESYLDSYKNFTIKTMMTLKWITTYCNRSRFILRVDDDVVVNVAPLLQSLYKIRFQKNKLIGNYFPNSGIDRRPDAKFYISYEQYNQSRYYPYCEGTAFILTIDLAKSIYELSRHVRWEPFSTWLDDVYIGMLASYLNASFIQYGQHFSSPDQYSYVSYSQLKNMNREYLYFVYIKDPIKEMKPVWLLLNE